MKVCEKVEQKGKTTYNEVADELVAEFAVDTSEGASALDQQYDEKNIRRYATHMHMHMHMHMHTHAPAHGHLHTPLHAPGGSTPAHTPPTHCHAPGGSTPAHTSHAPPRPRRVYDALNVLMAMDIITKEKKNIMWRGLPTNTEQEGARLKACPRHAHARTRPAHATHTTPHARTPTRPHITPTPRATHTHTRHARLPRARLQPARLPPARLLRPSLLTVAPVHATLCPHYAMPTVLHRARARWTCRLARSESIRSASTCRRPPLAAPSPHPCRASLPRTLAAPLPHPCRTLAAHPCRAPLPHLAHPLTHPPLTLPTPHPPHPSRLAAVQELLTQQISFKNLVQRNGAPSHEPGDRIPLPFIIVNTHKETVTDPHIT